MSFQKAYTLATNAPPAPSWDEYSQAVQREYEALLRTRNCRERVYQKFLEKHPSLLPWMYGTFGGGHHGLIHGAVVTQPQLPAVGRKHPDFMMITRDTSSVYAVLIEIESPCKKWFTSKGQPTAPLTQAMNQIREWRAWFGQAGNREKFYAEYRVPYPFNERRFEQRYILIYGQRDELVQSGFAHMRAQHQQDDERLLSFEHLRPNENLRDAVTARVDSRGYHAVSIPPTLRLGPFQAEDLVGVRNKERVVRVNPLMPSNRADFLKARFPYWDNMVQTGLGMRSTGDFE